MRAGPPASDALIPVAPRIAAVTMAVIRGARTIDDVAAAIGLSRSGTQYWMAQAREAGFIEWGEGAQGNLSTRLQVVANTPRRNP